MSSGLVKEFRDELEEVKRGSVVQLLFRCARMLNEQSIARLRRVSGESRIRKAHTLLFPHISLEGTRLTTLASQLGVSKQAVAQLVDELVGLGMLEKVPDPSDGRARLIRFSAEGQQGLMAGLAVLGQVQEELEERLGKDRIDEMHETLLLLQEELEQRPLESE